MKLSGEARRLNRIVAVLVDGLADKIDALAVAEEDVVRWETYCECRDIVRSYGRALRDL